MSKSIKLKNNSYIDSSSILYKRRNLNEVLIEHFQIPSTRGEVRYSKIAELTTNIGSGRIGLVHNQSTGLSEIWLESNAWNLPIYIFFK